MQGNKASIFTEAQMAEIGRLKAYFPYRVVWAAVNAETGEFHCGANATRKQLNIFMRRGAPWLCFTA
jgi:hypothetical protein